MAGTQGMIEIVVQARDEASQVITELGDSLSSLPEDINSSSTALGELNTQSTNTARVVNNASDAIDNAGNRSRTSAVDIQSLGTQFGALVGSATALVSTLASFFFPIQEAAQFERAMSEVGAISGATGDDLARLSDLAREMGAETEFSAQQAAEGLKNLAMAGLNVDEAYDALPNVLRLAQAGAVDLGVAADIATNIMSGFQMKAEDLSRVNDVLVATFTTTNSSLTEIGNAMKYAAPVASSLGMSFEETASAIGLFHNAGLKGETAGTQLRAVLTSLVDPSKEAKAELDKLAGSIGESSFQAIDSTGNIQSFANILKFCEESGMTASQAMKIFGQEAGTGMLAMLSVGSEGLKTHTELLLASKGRTEEVSEVIRNNAIGAWREFKSAVSELSITFGEMFLPAVTSVLRGVVDLTNQVSDFIKENQTLVLTLTSVGGGLAVIISSMSIFKLSIGWVNDAWVLLSGSLGSGILETFATSIGTAIAAVTSFIGSLGALTIAVGAFVVAFNVSDSFREWILGFELFGVELDDWWQLIKAKLFQWSVDLGSFFSDTWLVIKSGFDSYMQICYKWDEELVQFFTNLANTLPDLVLSAFAWVDNNTGIVNELIQMQSAIRGTLGEILATIAQWGLDVVDVFKSVPVLSDLLGWADDTVGITEALESLKQKGLELSEQARQASVESAANYQALVNSARQAVEASQNEIIAQQQLNQVHQQAAALQTQISNTIKQIENERKAGLDELQKKHDEAKDKLEQHEKAYDTLVVKAEESLNQLTESTQTAIDEAWGKATSDTITENYTNALKDLETQTTAWGDREKDSVTDIQNKIGEVRRLSIENAINQADELYTQQLERIKTYENSKVDFSQLSYDKQLEAEKEVSKKIEERSKEVLDKKKEYFEKAKDALENELGKSLAIEKDIAKQIIQVNQDIKDSKLSAEEKIRELKRKSMTDEEVYQDKLKEYNELMSQAQKQVGVDYEEAMRLGKKAQEVAADLVRETKEGTVDTTIAIDKIKESQEFMEKAASSRLDVLSSSLDLTKKNSSAIDDSLREVDRGLGTVTQRLEKGFEAKIDIDTDKFNRDIEELQKTTALKIKAEADFNQAFEELKEFKQKTLDLQETAKIKIEIVGKQEINEFFEKNTLALDKFKEEIKLKITKGEELKDTDLTLAEMTGYYKELSKDIELKVLKSDSLNEAETQIKSLADKLQEIKKDENRKVDVEITGLKKAGEEAQTVEDKLNAIAASDPSITISGLSEGESAAQAILSKLQAMDGKVTHSTHIIHEKTVQEKNTGGRIYARTGKRIPGYGGGDTVPAMLEAGEWVVRKEAVAKYGDDVMAKINSGVDLPAFAVGGKNLVKMPSYNMIPSSQKSSRSSSQQETPKSSSQDDSIKRKLDYKLMDDEEKYNEFYDIQAEIKQLKTVMLKATKQERDLIKIEIQELENTYNEMGGHVEYQRVTEKMQELDELDIQKEIENSDAFKQLQQRIAINKTNYNYAKTIPGVAVSVPQIEQQTYTPAEQAEIDEIVNQERRIKKSATSAYQEEKQLKTALSALTKSRYATGGSPDNMVNALVERGEWIIGKESVAKYGDDFLNQINTMQFPLSKFQAGGKTGGIPTFATGKQFKKLDDIKLNSGGSITNLINSFSSVVKRMQGGIIPSVSKPSLPKLNLTNTTPTTIKHALTFNFGGKAIGEFTGDKTSINDLISQLQQAQMLI